MKIICIGNNYKDHVKEMQSKLPEEPVFFLKSDSCLLLRNNPFYIPEFSNEIHYEIETVLKISKVGKCIEPQFAHRYYNAIGLGIDFTARDIQNKSKKLGLPWASAKAFDGSAVLSEFYPIEKFKNINNLDFSLHKNDVLVQKGNTGNMIFSFDEIVSYVSKFMTLKLGDYIYTGTPAGVGKININDKLTGYLGNIEAPLINMKIK
ncbi:MAG: fumarylacetoacetate hydrolase family protein [Bacteroidales bacterium]|nr:fumarylacetoacetate hydrolase family protein [Bacteroidales bacterium]